MILVVYLGHGIFHPVEYHFFVFSSIQCLEEVLSSQIEEPQKQIGAPLSS